MEDLSQWPTVLQSRPSLLNNTSFSIIKKTPNKVTYKFLPRMPLNLCLAIILANTFVTLTMLIT